jgi:HAD superfamily hydrolase (TIGR01509 family)
MNSSNIRAVLWDLDGTLADSAEYHWLSWRDTLKAEGVEISYEQFLASFGQKNDRILSTWLPPPHIPEVIQRIGDAKEEEYRRLARTRGLTPLPGAVAWVARLHEGGWRQAIASSAPRLNVEAMLDALNLTHYFDAIASAEDVTAGKPDPQVFLAAAGKLNVSPDRCVVVEDAAAGIEAARRAGMASIGVNPTSRLDADIAVSSLDELPRDAFDRLLAIRQA